MKTKHEETSEQEPLAPVSDPVEEVPVISEAVVVFDAEFGETWLQNGHLRLKGAYPSVRFEPKGMREAQFSFMLSLAAESIAKTVYNRLGYPLGPGVLYVPKALVKHPALEGMKRGEATGDYVAFHRP